MRKRNLLVSDILTTSSRSAFASKAVWAVALGASSLFGTNAALAQSFTFTPPAGLAAGSTYRLVFETSGTIAGTSTDINTYNNFAAAQAALSTSLPTTTWAAIASTAAVSAVDNISCTGSCLTDPIYLVTGVEVATQQSGLFATTPGGTNVTLLSAIDVTQFGVTLVSPPSPNLAYVWTGTKADGSQGASGYDLGGNIAPLAGQQGLTSGQYLYNGNFAPTNLLPIYAISAELTVPQGSTSVPEPGTAPVLAAGLALLAGLGWRRHASKSV